MIGRPPTPEATRFARKYVVDGNGCWIWQSKRDKNGYGSFSLRTGATCRAHRWSYEHHVAPIPDGLVIDHLCRVTSCVNPSHLEPVTPRENYMRGDTSAGNATRTGMCKRGHELAGENLIVNKKAQRSCRTCQRMKAEEWRLAQPKPEPAPSTLLRLAGLCQQGHPLREDRTCRVCHRRYEAAYRARRDEQTGQVA